MEALRTQRSGRRLYSVLGTCPLLPNSARLPLLPLACNSTIHEHAGMSCMKPACAVSASFAACGAQTPTAQRCSPLLPVLLSITTLCRSDDARAALHWVQVRDSMGKPDHKMPPHPAWNALGAKLKRRSEAPNPTPTLPTPHTRFSAQQNSEAWQGQHSHGEAALQPGLAAHMRQVGSCSIAASCSACWPVAVLLLAS